MKSNKIITLIATIGIALTNTAHANWVSFTYKTTKQCQEYIGEETETGYPTMNCGEALGLTLEEIKQLKGNLVMGDCIKIGSKNICAPLEYNSQGLLLVEK